MDPSSASNPVKLSRLKERHSPDGPGFVWPYQQRDSKRHLSQKHLDDHQWLFYSKEKKGLFCRYCVFFADRENLHKKGGKTEVTFIELPCIQYGRLTGNGGYVTNHENTNYHKKAAAHYLRTTMSED